MIKIVPFFFLLIMQVACSSGESAGGGSGGFAVPAANNNQSSTEENPLDNNEQEVLVGASIDSIILPANGTYADGSDLLFQVNFSEAVNVSGFPRLRLNIGGQSRYAVYSGASGPDGVEFSYTIQAGEDDPDGISFQSSSIDLNGGSLQNASDSLNTSLSFSAVVGSTASILVDTASGITAPDQVTGVVTAPTTQNDELSVAWAVPNDNGTSILAYIVQYREQGTSSWINVTPAPSINQTTISNLSAGVTYEVRVAANNGLNGAYSSVSTAEIFDVLDLNPIAWLSATDINNGGVAPAHGDRVASWSDLTGKATDATESTVSKQPIYETNVQNGLPAVRFDGTQDRGLEGSFVRENNAGLTVILVGSMDTNTVRRAFFEFYQDGSPTSGASSRRGFFFTYGFGVASTNYHLDDNGFNVWVAYDTGTNSSLWENGTQKYANVNNYFGRTDFLGNGIYVLGDDQTGGDRLSGHIGEFLVFDKQLSPAELATITNYLQNKWGTP